MRTIDKPDLNKIDIYNTCCSSVGNSKKQKDLKNYLYIYLLNGTLYNYESCHGNLYTLPSISKPVVNHKNFIEYEDIKDNLKQLYSQQMVSKEKPARKYYDKLKSLAPLEKCPFCGIGQVSTLDHYLPKAEFPIFSVLPYNLVACCKDCNTGKLASYATTQNTQTLHPYYDDFTTQQWLYAKVLQSLKIEFYVEPPVSWSQVDKDRVQSHFENYKLGGRFSVEASNILANLNYKFTQYFSNSTDIKKELEREYNINKNLHLNSWETAMYQALYQNKWYCDGGYLQ